MTKEFLNDVKTLIKKHYPNVAPDEQSKYSNNTVCETLAGVIDDFCNKRNYLDTLTKNIIQIEEKDLKRIFKESIKELELN